MAKSTNIGWCKSTWNPWIGCDKIAPACDNCYAAEWDRRFRGGQHWGPGSSRHSQPHKAAEVLAWNRQAPDSEFAGRKGFWPVFVESMGDFFDNRVPAEWRDEAWAVMRECRNLTFIIVTKRVGNVLDMLPPDWSEGWPNVWLLVTVWDQASADRDVPKLLNTPARVRGLSMEPLLGLVDLRSLNLSGWGLDHLDALTGEWSDLGWVNTTHFGKLDWIIVGGETGAKARHLDGDWVKPILDQCTDINVPFFFKQWSQTGIYKGKKPGNTLRSRIWQQWPEARP